MKYIKISIKYEYFKDRLNRTILVKGDPDLFKLSAFIGYILGCAFEHTYLIMTKNDHYVLGRSMDDLPDFGCKYLGRHYLSELPNEFEYAYDLGEGYYFICKKEGEVDLKSRTSFILESGKGQGIWEDNSSSLEAYLRFEISPYSDNSESLNKRGYYLPWNFDNETFGDFDNSLDIEQMNIDFKKEFSYVFNKLKKDEEEYIESMDISLDDRKPYRSREIDNFKKS